MERVFPRELAVYYSPPVSPDLPESTGCLFGGQLCMEITPAGKARLS